MKNVLTLYVLFLSINFTFSQENETDNNLSENFSLEGTLAMFKNANSLEDFEKLINTENNSINNLDLNKDGNIDYISVNAIKENDSHVIVLSTFLNENDKQDIAVIGIEKTGDKEAQLQIIGDENLFGKNAIVEPFEITETLEEGKGPSNTVIIVDRVVVNVWFWSCVQFVYAPNYIVYASPFRWRVYPNWWKPWRPISVVVFRPRLAIHKANFHRTSVYRVHKVREVYVPRRSHSTTIVKSRRGTTVIHNGKRGKSTVVKRRR